MNEQGKNDRQNSALIDNSIFAGIMRNYIPDLNQHKLFIELYPKHKKTDTISVAQFLTSICLFDKIFLESSSKIDTSLLQYGIQTEENPAQIDWVVELLEFLPPEVTKLIETTESSISNDDSIRIAYNLISSKSTRDKIIDLNAPIPKTYTASDYHYKPFFEEINKDNLSQELLNYAMFIHRGIFLQNLSISENHTYIPFSSRGEMLVNISPLISSPVSNYTNLLDFGIPNPNKPDISKIQKELNHFYYELINKITWIKYDENIPFIGAAILARTKGNMEDAFNLALEIRNEGKIKKEWEGILEAVESNDRSLYENLLKSFENDLSRTSTKFGLDMKNERLEATYNLAVSWLPYNIDKVIELAIELLPDNFKHWGRRFSNRLLYRMNSPSQLLFIEHVKSIKSNG